MSNDSFLVLFLVFIALMTVFPMVLRRFNVPGVIALLIVGMIVGPNALDLIGHLSYLLSYFGGSAEASSQNFTFLVNSLGSLGLVLLMALAGMEADFKLIRSARKPVIALSVLTFLVPAATGYFVFQFFRPDDLPGKLLYASLFASHSVGIVFPVIRELKLSKSRFGASVLISTVVTDVASIILLAVSVQLKKLELGGGGVGGGVKTLSVFDYIDVSGFGNWFTPFFLVVVMLYLLLAVLVVNGVGKWIMRRTKGNVDAVITFLILVILGTVLAGELLGINLVVGAFIAGLALAGLIRQTEAGSAIFYKFEGIGWGLLIPFLFVKIGMESDFSAFSEIGNIAVILLTVGGLAVSKIASGWLAMRLSGFGNLKGLCAGLMTVPQLSATLAAAAVGKSLGMLDDNFFNAVIIMSIVTTLPIPNLVRLVIARGKLQFEDVAPQEAEAYRIPPEIEDGLL